MTVILMWYACLSVSPPWHLWSFRYYWLWDSSLKAATIFWLPTRGSLVVRLIFQYFVSDRDWSVCVGNAMSASSPYFWHRPTQRVSTGSSSCFAVNPAAFKCHPAILSNVSNKSLVSFGEQKLVQNDRNVIYGCRHSLTESRGREWVTSTINCGMIIMSSLPENCEALSAFAYIP